MDVNSSAVLPPAAGIICLLGDPLFTKPSDSSKDPTILITCPDDHMSGLNTTFFGISVSSCSKICLGDLL
jgi:hypothetical protein